MEYPQITVIGKVNSKSSLETVIVHEVGHNWFQGMLGSNERQHAWMDEGINTYAAARTLATDFPEIHLDRYYFGGFVPWAFAIGQLHPSRHGRMALRNG